MATAGAAATLTQILDHTRGGWINWVLFGSTVWADTAAGRIEITLPTSMFEPPWRIRITSPTGVVETVTPASHPHLTRLADALVALLPSPANH